MELGMIGLGRMGASMVLRLQKAGHHCVVFDTSADAVAASAKQGEMCIRDRSSVRRRAELDFQRQGRRQNQGVNTSHDE